jgi:chromate transport protein ChrA
MSRNVVWSAIVLYAAVVFFAFQWSGYAAAVLLVAGAVAWFVVMKNRNQFRGTRFSTSCERCDAPLAEHAGMPAGTCLACGHVQSWADK